MPIEAWDVNAPSDANLVRDGDDAIRQVKRAINERMQRLANNWPDGDDTLTIKAEKVFGTYRFSIGPYANRPPAAPDIAYYATDRRTLYLAFDDSGVFVWQEVAAVIKQVGAIPAAADLETGQIALVTTDQSLWFKDATAVVRRLAGADEYSRHDPIPALGLRLDPPVAVQAFVTGGTYTAGDVNGDYLITEADFAQHITNFGARARRAIANAYDSGTGTPLIASARIEAAGVIIRCRNHDGTVYNGTIQFGLLVIYDA